MMVKMMETMISRFRLQSSAFSRTDEEIKVPPKRMIILSVEGDQTERRYFEHLNDHLDNSIIKVEVLRHRKGDGYSDPQYVIELLNEYKDLREGDLIPEDLPSTLLETYSKEFISRYLENPDSITSADYKRFKEELILVGIDIEYRKYLKIFTNENDLFGVIIDRDCDSHSKELMEKCISICDQKGYSCYVSNPCFEFWLLLHLCDVKSEFSQEQLQELLVNKKVSNNHTTTSLEVSNRARHSKDINKKVFDSKYYPNISNALIHAKEFEGELPQLLDSLGTNIPQLMNILGYSVKQSDD